MKIRGMRVLDPGYEGIRSRDEGIRSRVQGYQIRVRGYEIRGTRVNPEYDGMRFGIYDREICLHVMLFSDLLEVLKQCRYHRLVQFYSRIETALLQYHSTIN